MTANISTNNFGSLLKFLRKRAHMTQRDLAQAVGYTEAHLCRLEKNERLPDLTTVAALFIPALDLKDDPAMIERLLKLAARARDERLPTGVKINQVTIEHRVERELGTLEEIPAPTTHYVERPALTQRIRSVVASEHSAILCGIPGTGKTTLAATLARTYSDKPVFWHTFIADVSTSSDSIIRQLALFLFSHGQTQLQPLVERRADAAPMPLDQQLLFLRSALAAQPSLLCFDDVHLVLEHERSLAILRQLSATPSASVLMTSRQNVPLPATQINIEGLELDEARQLVDQLGLRLAPDVLERLLAKTDHSPMLLRLAIGQLLETRADAHAFIEHLETQPQVVSYLLHTILNDLLPSTQWLAKLLSVFRHPLDLYDETLTELIEKMNPPGSFDDAVGQLQNFYLIDEPRRASLHPLVHNHLFTALSVDTPLKKRLHRLAADWSERAAGDMVETAYHWMLAGDLEQATEIIGEQSETLFNRGQSRAAVQVVDEALMRTQRRRSDTASLRRRLLTARGDLLRGTSRAAESESSYREALALAQGFPSARAQIVRNLAQILLQRGQTAEALRLCQSAMADLSSADTVLRARLASVEARAHLALSHYNDAERIASEAIALADQFAEALPQVADDVRARAERTLGWVNYTRHPEGAESLVHYRRALECARRAGLRVIECAILSNTATALLERGDTEGALQAYQEAIQGYRSLGDLYGEAGILHNLGVLHSGREETDLALLRMQQASQIERRIGDREGLLSTESARASLLMGKGKLAEARKILEAVLIEGQGSTDTWTLGTCLCLLAEAQMMERDVDRARASVDQVMNMPGISNNARIRAWAQTDLVLIHLVTGNVAGARDTVAGAPPNDLGYELTTRWQLVQSAVALATGDLVTARSIAQNIEQAATQKGLKQLAATARKLVADPSLPAADLPRVILIDS